MKISDEVVLTDEVLHLIRCNGKELCFVGSGEEAQLTIDSFAASQGEVLQDDNDNIKVFREDLSDGSVVLSTQIIGIVYNGPITVQFKYDSIPCSRVVYIKSRHELPSEPKDFEKREEIPPSLANLVAKYSNKEVVEKPLDV